MYVESLTSTVLACDKDEQKKSERFHGLTVSTQYLGIDLL